jgi:hypothetical protein
MVNWEPFSGALPLSLLFVREGGDNSGRNLKSLIQAEKTSANLRKFVVLEDTVTENFSCHTIFTFYNEQGALNVMLLFCSNV